MLIDSLFKARSFIFDIEFEAETHVKEDNLDYLKAKPQCIAFAWQHDGQMCSYVCDWDTFMKDYFFDVCAMMQDANVKKCGANIKIDAKVFEHNTKQRVNGIYFDTVVASKLIDENSDHDMESLSMLYLNEPIKFPYPEHVKVETAMTFQGKKVKKRGIAEPIEVLEPDLVTTKIKQDEFDKNRMGLLLQHCQEDVEQTFKLVKCFTPKLKVMPSLSPFKDMEINNLFDWLTKIEAKVIEIFVHSELKGIPVRKDRLEELTNEYGTRLQTLLKGLQTFTGNDKFNPNSGQQVAKYLYADRTPRFYTDGSKNAATPIGKTDGDELEFWADKGVDFAVKMLEYKRWSSLISKGVKPILEAVVDGRIHASFNTYGTVTGRFSCNHPNLQNIPSRDDEASKIRGCFEGLYNVLDYSQIEPRLLGHFANEPLLIESYGRGEGVYEPIMLKKGLTRPDAKTFYLASTYKLDDEFYSLLPNVKKFKDGILGDWQWEQRERRDGATWMARVGKSKLGTAYQLGYTESIAGIRRHVPEMKKWLQFGTNTARVGKKGHVSGYSAASADERECFNHIMQASCANIQKAGMVKLAETKEYKDGKFYIPSCVHDETLILIEDDTLYKSEKFLEKCKACLLEPYKHVLRIPLEVEGGFGASWEEAK